MLLPNTFPRSHTAIDSLDLCREPQSLAPSLQNMHAPSSLRFSPKLSASNIRIMDSVQSLYQNPVPMARSVECSIEPKCRLASCSTLALSVHDMSVVHDGYTNLESHEYTIGGIIQFGKTVVWYCGNCGDGPHNISILAHCSNCGHGRDSCCTVGKAK